jgi:membrane peptidoglycan carboxypeptidase
LRSFEKNLLIRRRHARRAALLDQRQRGWRRLWISLLAALTSIAALAVIALGWAYVSFISDLPPVEELVRLLDPQSGALLQPTRLYDRTGEHLIYSLENPGILRRPLPIDPARVESISPALIQTVLALQDPDFFTQPALRLTNLNDPRPDSIAEKLVAELLLSDEVPGLRKSVRMRLLASQALSRFGRLQILEWYLNHSSFGRLSYGADAAAQLYLGKPASQLDWAEAALLGPLLDAPALNPLDAPAAALERQREALAGLFNSGVIDAATFAQAAGEELTLRSDLPAPQSPALAFSQRALDQLAAQIGRQRLERGGLKVITSLDYDLQIQLSCALRTQLARAGPGSEALPASEDCPGGRLLPALPPGTSTGVDSPPLTASALILDPASGQVLALAGDTNLQNGESAILRSRPPGNLTAPFLALTAFARGLSPASLVWDIPASLEGFSNPDGRYLGPLSLRSALICNRAAPLTQQLIQLGPGSFLTTARSLGLTSLRLPADARETFLKGEPVDPLEVAMAYSVFANLGQLNGAPLGPSGQITAALILRVEDSSGRILLSNEISQSQALVSPQLAYLVHDVLSDEPSRWPILGYPNPLEIGRPAGAFSARSADGLSTWTVGYTRRHLALAWLGVDGEESGQGLDPRLAAGLWHALIQYASRDLPGESWEMPPGLVRLEVCSPSGLLPTPHCPSVVSEVFLEGSQPTGADNLYRRYQINRETGRLATVFTPPELVEERTYLVVPAEAQEWARQAGLPLPPQDYDAVQAPPPNPDAHITSPAQFSVVRGKIDILGRAAGADFLSYSLQVGQGINPTSWLTIRESSSDPVEDGLLTSWDASGLDGLYAVRLQVVRSGQRIDTAVLQVTVDNTLPKAMIPYPLPGQGFERASQPAIIFQADVEDNVGIRRVEWWLDGRKVGERGAAPFALVWDALPGAHTLQIRAVDLAGNLGRSEEISFTVK